MTTVRRSDDGSFKFLFALDDGRQVESVLMPDHVRNYWTQCLSSQVGCAVDCKFCVTGFNGFFRHMRADEIVSRLDGVLLTGSPSNVEPARYGEDDAGEGPFDPDRDRMMRDLVEAVIAAQRPLFGICRGFQDINVALGGTLHQLAPHPKAQT